MSIGSIGGTYGLSGSGMDIDSLVKKLMSGQQAKEDALVQKKTIAEWQKSAYNTVYDDISNFRNTIFNYKLMSTLSPNKVSSSNNAVATASANSDAAEVSHSLSVTQLADSVKLTSRGNVFGTSSAGKLVDLLYGSVNPGAIQVKITNGTLSKTIDVDPNGTINDFVNSINSAGINVKANYDTTLDRFFIYSTNTGSSTGISFDGSNANGLDFMLNKMKLIAPISGSVSGTGISGNSSDTLNTQFGITGSFNLNVNGKQIAVSSSNTLNDIMGAINGDSSINATASYSNGTFTITPTNGSTTIDFAGSDANALDFLSSKLKLNQLTDHNGKDAIFNLDGVNNLTQSSNTFTISGVTYNLLSEGSSTNIAVTNDVDAAVASVQSFVDSYNKILVELNGKLDEERYKDYQPLTDAQKAAMKDADITAWTDKAKSGMLHHDDTLTSLVNSMRNAVSNPIFGINTTIVSGQSIIYNSAASIGITTGAYTEGGKLYLDTNKLRTALQNNPDVLNQIFGSKGTTTTVNGKIVTDTQTQGIAGRLYDGIKATMDNLVTIAGTTGSAQYDTNSDFAKRIKDYNTQISNVQDRFDTMQSAFYKQFNAMEVALSQLNSQSSWLSSQLSNNG